MVEGTSSSHTEGVQTRKNTRPNNRSRANGRNRPKKSETQGNSGKKSNKKTSKPRDINSDYKVLEIFKLLKNFKPITINGIPVTTIVKQEEKRKLEDKSESVSSQENNAQSDKGPSPKQKKTKQIDILKHYIIRVFTNQPNKPIYFSFVIKPSDPDFPFDLESLKLSLCIPYTYPYNKDSRPSIFILNDEIPKGFAANIELGFKRIVGVAMNNEIDEEIEMVNGKGLSSQLQTLDKYLELFLKQKKKDTIKFVKQKKKSTSPMPMIDVQSSSPLPTPRNLTPSPSPSPVVLDQRNQLVNEMINKLHNNVKILRKGTSTKYKIIIPINEDSLSNTFKPSPPELWCLHKSVELFLHIPLNYPESNLTISIPNNFSEYLIKEHGNIDDLQSIKLIERNLVRNFGAYKFKHVDLTYTMNWLSNYLGVFCLSEEEFSAMLSLLLV